MGVATAPSSARCVTMLHGLLAAQRDLASSVEAFSFSRLKKALLE